MSTRLILAPPPQIFRPSVIPVDRYITGQSHYGVIPVNFSEMHQMQKMIVLENSIAFFNRIYVLYFSGYAYEASAHLVQIWCRGSLHSSFNKNYVYTHVSYLHPEIILRNSNVCLHSVTSTMALFAIAKHSVDIFNFNKYVKKP